MKKILLYLWIFLINHNLSIGQPKKDTTYFSVRTEGEYTMPRTGIDSDFYYQYTRYTCTKKHVGYYQKIYHLVFKKLQSQLGSLVQLFQQQIQHPQHVWSFLSCLIQGNTFAQILRWNPINNKAVYV